MRPFQDRELRVFVGRASGQAARVSARLDQLDRDSTGERVVVQFPDDTWDVSSGFWLGMFGDSVRRLRADGFRARYEFSGAILQEDIEAGIEEALLEERPLSAHPSEVGTT